jgi:hypothetical protein
MSPSSTNFFDTSSGYRLLADTLLKGLEAEVRELNEGVQRRHEFGMFSTRSMLLVAFAPDPRWTKQDQEHLDRIDGLIRKWIRSNPFRDICWKCWKNGVRTELDETQNVRCLHCLKLICPKCEACNKDDDCPAVGVPVEKRLTFTA